MKRYESLETKREGPCSLARSLARQVFSQASARSIFSSESKNLSASMLLSPVHIAEKNCIRQLPKKAKEGAHHAKGHGAFH